ncbi:MAG TPA: alkaline phosphatase family protein [Vicinamibacteria bacterium]|nr:alkaline phosphatase family protein [Vicinamibacteria bacterium]
MAAALALLTSQGGRAQTRVAPPRLVLFVAVDQMRYDYLERFAPLFQAGFKKLLGHGAVFSHALYRHANTETGPGHALLLSGRHARDNGIVANSWYDRVTRKSVNVVEDPTVTPVGGPGKGRSPASFIGQTLGDRLKKASPSSRVVGVALKDRSAILMAGPRADAAYWYDDDTGRFITSSYYTKTAPPWLVAWNAEGKVDALNGGTWNRLLPDLSLYERYAGPDAVEGEWDRKDTVFPHRIRGAARSEEFYDDLRRTPYADELTLDVALRALEAHGLGDDEATDLLAVGFSATDVIGHTYGPDSQEVMDQMLRLDRTLGRLLDEVERRTGSDGYLFGLGADHGVMPLVELSRARGLPARRARPEEIERPVRAALAAGFPGKTGLIAYFDDPHFYLDLEALARQGVRRADVEAWIEKAALETGLVQRVYTAGRLLGDPPAGDPEFGLFRNAFFEPRSPHVLLRLKDHVYVDDEYEGGTGHGTAALYDRHVAMGFLGPRVRPGRYAEPCGPEEIAPTLHALLGLDYPLETGQRVLKEMLMP